MNCLRNLFYFRIFRQNGVKSCYKYENTKNRHIWTSMTPKLRSVHSTGESGNKNFCAVKLCGMHHTAESNCTPRIQNWNLCESLVAFKGTIRRNPVRGHLSWKKTFEEKIFDLLSLKFWLSGGCNAHRRVELFELCDRISWQNRNRIGKYFSLFIRGPGGFESWKKIEIENLVTHSL